MFDQLADLGAAAGFHPRAGSSFGNPRHRLPLDRLHRQAALRGDRGNGGPQIEAVTATGASRLQVLNYGIVPQVMPTFYGISVFRWDINIRESAILGLVGAGGIGSQLQASLNVLAWPQVTVIILVILGTVVVSEWVSARVRHAII